jgi:outer membrane protein OmpA-like peptidoglycan-associated protein
MAPCRTDRNIKMIIYCALLALTVTFSTPRSLTFAQERASDAQILNALYPKKARGLPIAPADPARVNEERRDIDAAIHNAAGRGLGRVERDQLAAIAKGKPQIDLEIYFEYDSATISSDGMEVLKSLGKALSAAELSGSVFMIAGHTDGKGSAEYNLALSQGRAGAVKQALMEKFKLPSDSLFFVGYGKEHLKDAEHPFDGKNRRVQVVNIAQRPASGNR